jgi:predicted MPP superfamily phosphohydrolase
MLLLMHPFVLIVGSLLVGDVAWWLWADRRVRRTKHPMLWRPLVGLFSGLQLGYLLWFITFPTEGRHAHAWMPIPALAAIYVWHLLVLPMTLLVVIGDGTVRAIAWRWRRRQWPVADMLKTAAPPTFTRRQALGAAAMALPPLLTGGGVALAMKQIHQFRINRIELPLAGLPIELDGMTIAQVSDVHVGRFTRAGMLPAIVDATNSLKADLVLLTGDLIDLTLADLPVALDFVRKLDPRSGLFMCEGNHDLIEDPIGFETQVRAAGVPLLLDESAIATVRGRPVQLLGTTWGRGEVAIVGSISRLVPQRRPDAFSILLAHHPHAFDTAAAVGFPLTLSGHTHGGQIMLNERLGAGSIMFRYWSGVYRNRDAALVVSNGVGNWFPLRLHAPAEIVHLTLRSAPTA